MSIERIERTPMDEERLAALRALFPEVFTDGRVNVERLRELLAGEAAELGPDEEHYGLRWPGQKKARQLANRPATGTLRTAPGEGVDEATTQNLLVVGDNLEVLRILRKSYEGRVKLIYIDPPYNTGNDFVYRDDFRDPVDAYLEATKQADTTGLLTSNPRSSGRFHSAWLTMMHPRLALARHMLTPDGLIFVSLDDTETHNCRMVMDEVFGAENFLACIAWEKRYTRSNNAKLFYSLKDSILVYRRSEVTSVLKDARTEKADQGYKNPDNDPRGPWMTSSYVNPASKDERPNLVYPITAPDGRVIEHPTNAWKYGRDEHLRHVAESLLWWGKDGDATFPRLKLFLEEAEGMVPVDLWDYETTGTTDEGGQELKALMGGVSPFDNPKPTRLLRRIMQLASRPNTQDIILDFFAGSGTTGEAVMRLNAEDGGNRRFILVQLPEPTQKGDYATIDQITKARLRAASAAIKAEQASKLDLDARGPQDLGFRVLHEARSQVQRWVATAPSDPQQVLDLFRAHNGLVADCNRDDLLIEVMLLEGWPLDATVTRSPAISTNEVMVVEHPDRPAKLLVCLENEIYEDTVEKLADHEKAIFVCLEVALNDAVKVRIADIKDLRVKTL